MLEGLNKWLGRKEAEKMAAMTPDEEDQIKTDSTDLDTWMKGSKAKGFEGETSDKSYEVTAGELHTKHDAATAKQIADIKKHEHPHLELVENKSSKHTAVTREVKNPFVEVANDNETKETELLSKLDRVQADLEKSKAEIAAIREELKLLKAKKRVEVA